MQHTVPGLFSQRVRVPSPVCIPRFTMSSKCCFRGAEGLSPLCRPPWHPSKVWRPEFDLQLHMERNKSGHGGVFVVPALQQPALKPGRKPSTLSHQASSSNVTMEIRLLFWAWSPFLACGLRARLGLFSLWATSGDELASENFTTQAYEWLFTVLQARRSKVSGLQSFCPFRGSGEKLLLFGSQVFLCL